MNSPRPEKTSCGLRRLEPAAARGAVGNDLNPQQARCPVGSLCVREFRMRGTVAVGACALVLGLAPGSAAAGIFPAACSSGVGDPNSLAAAITGANGASGPDTVELSAGCTYTLTGANNHWYGPNGLPQIASAVTIEGRGATIARSPAAPKFRLFFVGANPTDSATPSYVTPGAGNLTLRDVTLTGGLARGGDSYLGGGGAGMGGAIFSQGVVTVERSTLTGNFAAGGAANNLSAGNGGGGIGTDATAGFGGGMGASFPGGASGGAGSTPNPGLDHAGGGAGFGTTDSGLAGSNGGAGGGGANGMGGRGGHANGGAAGNGSGGGGGGDSAGSTGDGGGFGVGGESTGGGGGVGGGGGRGSFAAASGGGGFGAGGGQCDSGFGLAGCGAAGFGGGGGGDSDGTAPGSTGFGGGTPSGREGGGGAGMGGAIFNMQGTLAIRNSTLTGNNAVGGPDNVTDSGKGMGGALFNVNGTVSITGSTLAANSGDFPAGDGGASLYNVVYDGATPRAAQVTLQDTIVADGVGDSDLVSNETDYISPAQSGTASVAIGDSNLVESAAAFDGATIGGTALTADPQLGPLADNGGATRTMAPAAPSPVLDAGAAFGLTTDQRGLPRPLDLLSIPNAGDGSDIGALEVQTQPSGGGGGGDGQGTSDSTAPAFVGRVTANPSTFAVNPRGAPERAVTSRRRTVRKGTTFRFRLSEAARVVFTIERRRTGRRVGRSCRRQTPANRRRPRCIRYTRISAFATPARQGPNAKRFSGRIGRRRLVVASYRARLLATDTARNRSRPRLVAFRIVRP
jgi:hypothetical protein